MVKLAPSRKYVCYSAFVINKIRNGEHCCKQQGIERINAEFTRVSITTISTKRNKYYVF
jgi:hypothetical protein